MHAAKDYPGRTPPGYVMLLRLGAENMGLPLSRECGVFVHSGANRPLTPALSRREREPVPSSAQAVRKGQTGSLSPWEPEPVPSGRARLCEKAKLAPSPTGARASTESARQAVRKGQTGSLSPWERAGVRPREPRAMKFAHQQWEENSSATRLGATPASPSRDHARPFSLAVKRKLIDPRRSTPRRRRSYHA